MINKNTNNFATILLISTDLVSSDTISVRSHDHVDMTWYGNYDKVGVFPNGTETYRKIYLLYYGIFHLVDVLLMTTLLK